MEACVKVLNWKLREMDSDRKMLLLLLGEVNVKSKTKDEFLCGVFRIFDEFQSICNFERNLIIKKPGPSDIGKYLQLLAAKVRSGKSLQVANCFWFDSENYKYLYVSEYTSDIIVHLLKTEKKLKVFKRDFTRLFCFHYYSFVWFLHAQRKFSVRSEMVLLAGRLVIKALIKNKSLVHKLKVLMCAAFRIACKTHDAMVIKPALRFKKVFGTKVVEADITKMELKLLKIIDFKIYGEDPLTFVNYYFFTLDILDSVPVNICNLLLDLMSRYMRFAVEKPSFQAAVVVYSTLCLFKLECLWVKHEHQKEFYQLVKIEDTVIAALKCLSDLKENWMKSYAKKNYPEEIKYICLKYNSYEYDRVCYLLFHPKGLHAHE